jgi:hypothetical protein
MRVSNGIPFGCSLVLPVGAVHCVQTLKVAATNLQIEAVLAKYQAPGSLVRCAFSDRYLHSRTPLSFTPLLRLKRLYVCGNAIPLGRPLPLTGLHCKLRRNTEGNNHSDCNPNPNPNPNPNSNPYPNPNLDLYPNTEGIRDLRSEA